MFASCITATFWLGWENQHRERGITLKDNQSQSQLSTVRGRRDILGVSQTRAIFKGCIVFHWERPKKEKGSLCGVKNDAKWHFLPKKKAILQFLAEQMFAWQIMYAVDLFSFSILIYFPSKIFIRFFAGRKICLAGVLLRGYFQLKFSMNIRRVRGVHLFSWDVCTIFSLEIDSVSVIIFQCLNIWTISYSLIGNFC